MKDTQVDHEGQTFEVTTVPFGQFQDNQGAIWMLKPSQLETPKDVAQAINDLHESPPEFEIRYVWKHNCQIDAIYVHFAIVAKLPDGVSQVSLSFGNWKLKWTVTNVNLNRCLEYNTSDHSLWNYSPRWGKDHRTQSLIVLMMMLST